jgi:hypothetical protein
MRHSMMLVTAMVIPALALALIMVGCGSKCATSGSSAPGATNLRGKIVFIREGGKYSEVTVFTAAANGTNVRRLSDFGEGPRFSPGGTKVMMAGPTSDGQRITAGIIHSDGSPSSRRSRFAARPEPRCGRLGAKREAAGVGRLRRH